MPPDTHPDPPFWRRPLPGFVAIGITLLLFDLGVNGLPQASSTADGRILVPAAVLELADRQSQQVAQRPATSKERAAALDRYVREEVLVREARAMQLDRDDLIVRRRLIQKMEFLLEELIDTPKPTPNQLAAWLADHPDRYRRPPRVQVEQRFFSRDRREAPSQDATDFLSVLKGDPSSSAQGDPWPQPTRSGAWLTHQAVAGRFGAAFADAAFDAPEGAWVGPVESSFGAHLIRVTGRQPGSLPELSAVEQEVRRDWAAHTRDAALQERIDLLVDQYTVVPPEAPHAD